MLSFWNVFHVALSYAAAFDNMVPPVRSCMRLHACMHACLQYVCTLGSSRDNVRVWVRAQIPAVLVTILTWAAEPASLLRRTARAGTLTDAMLPVASTTIRGCGALMGRPTFTAGGAAPPLLQGESRANSRTPCASNSPAHPPTPPPSGSPARPPHAPSPCWKSRSSELTSAKLEMRQLRQTRRAAGTVHSRTGDGETGRHGTCPARIAAAALAQPARQRQAAAAAE